MAASHEHEQVWINLPDGVPPGPVLLRVGFARARLVLA